MKNTARKIFAILLAMMMAFDVIPFYAAAEGNGTDKDTGEYGGTFRDVLKNNRGTGISVSIDGVIPASKGYYVIAYNSSGGAVAVAEMYGDATLQFTFKSSNITALGEGLEYRIFYSSFYTDAAAVMSVAAGGLSSVPLSKSGVAGDYYFSWSNTPTEGKITIKVQPNATAAVVRFVDQNGNRFTDATSLGALKNKTWVMFKQEINYNQFYSCAQINAPSTVDQTISLEDNIYHSQQSYDVQRLLDIFICTSMDNTSADGLLYNNTPINKGGISGDYVLDSIGYEYVSSPQRYNKVFTFKKLPPRTVNINYYEVDGTTLDTSLSIPDGYYLAALYNNNWSIYAPINTDGTVGKFYNQGGTAIELPEVQDFKIINSINSLNGEPCDLSIYGITNPSPMETDSNNTYQIRAQKRKHIQ